VLQGKAGGGGDKNRFQKAGKPIEATHTHKTDSWAGGGTVELHYIGKWCCKVARQKFRPKSSKGATKKNFWPNFG
jgi:hypothetical protein